MTAPDESADEIDARADELEADELLRRAVAQAEILRLRARAKRRRDELARALPRAEPAGLLTLSELAARLGVSAAHVRRLDPPGLVVGDRKSKRFDLDEVRRWLAARDPKPTTPIKKAGYAKADDVDVSSVLAIANVRRRA